MEIQDSTARFSSNFHNFQTKWNSRKKPVRKIRKTRCSFKMIQLWLFYHQRFPHRGWNGIAFLLKLNFNNWCILIFAICKMEKASLSLWLKLVITAWKQGIVKTAFCVETDAMAAGVEALFSEHSSSKLKRIPVDWVSSQCLSFYGKYFCFEITTNCSHKSL